MKRRDLVARLEAAGWALARSKGPHDVYARPGRRPVAVPRHAEINEALARKILREASLGD